MKSLRESLQEYREYHKKIDMSLTKLPDLTKQDPVLIEMLQSDIKSEKVIALILLSAIEHKKVYFLMSFRMLTNLLETAKIELKVYPKEYKSIVHALCNNPFFTMFQKGTKTKASSFVITHDIILENISLNQNEIENQKRELLKYYKTNNVSIKYK